MVSPSAALIQFMAKHHTRNHVKKISKWIQIKKNQYNYRKETNDITTYLILISQFVHFLLFSLFFPLSFGYFCVLFRVVFCFVL
jgi:hypothetical protein